MLTTTLGPAGFTYSLFEIVVDDPRPDDRVDHVLLHMIAEVH